MEIGCIFKEDEGLSTYHIARFLKDLKDGTEFVSIELDPDHVETAKKLLKKMDQNLLPHVQSYASWLNQIEIFFGILTRKVVRQGIFKSGRELVCRLLTFIKSYNAEARPFQRTYSGNPLAA